MMFKKEESEIVEYVKTLINNAYAKNVYLTKFLSPKEQEVLKSMIGNKLFIYDDGGHINAQRKRFILSAFEINDPDLKIKFIELKADNNYYTLRHPTVKWHFLNLGIEERMFGDILEVDNTFYIAVADEVFEIVINESKKINRCNIKYKVVDDAVVESEKEEYLAFCTSLRLDGVCTKLFNISRNLAQRLIDSDKVVVNGILIKKYTSEIKEGDVINIKGYGKVIVIRTEINQRNGRYKIFYHKFLRK